MISMSSTFDIADLYEYYPPDEGATQLANSKEFVSQEEGNGTKAKIMI